MTGHVVALDDYEAANLREGLIALRRLGLDTGDWLGQMLLKLPHVEHRPNLTAEEQVERAARP